MKGFRLFFDNYSKQIKTNMIISNRKWLSNLEICLSICWKTSLLIFIWVLICKFWFDGIFWYNFFICNQGEKKHLWNLIFHSLDHKKHLSFLKFRYRIFIWKKFHVTSIDDVYNFEIIKLMKRNLLQIITKDQIKSSFNAFMLVTSYRIIKIEIKIDWCF